MCQQGRWHDQLEYLGIIGALFKFVVSIDPPEIVTTFDLVRSSTSSVWILLTGAGRSVYAR